MERQIVRNKFGDEILKVTLDNGRTHEMRRFDKAHLHQPCACCGSDMYGQPMFHDKSKSLRPRHVTCWDKPSDPSIPEWFPNKDDYKLATPFGDEEFESLQQALRYK